ncbi:MAG: nitroreductase family protein [Actinomycetes bacterium]|nr:nitroreductase family protein [Actinomycetes bacterium]
MTGTHHDALQDLSPNPDPETPDTNPTLALLHARASTRRYADRPVPDRVKRALLDATATAPTAGAMMLYSIIDVQDQAIKDRLAVLCDNQPFIARAPIVLVFVADWRKWLDLFAHTDCDAVADCTYPRDTVGIGDLLLSCCDALIAAQTATLAAESLGLGSCYIGDILEHCEDVAELLRLPAATLPITMLVAGYPHHPVATVKHQTENLVMVDHYRPADAETMDAQIAERDAIYPRRVGSERFANGVQALYARKFTSDFMHEMNRSCEAWLRRWSS